MQRTPQRALTLLEMLITLVILSILLTMAAPAFRDMMEKQRLKGASRDVYLLFTLARNEAIAKSTDIRVAAVRKDDGWFIGITDKDKHCDPSLTVPRLDDRSCTLRNYRGNDLPTLARLSHERYPGITLDNNRNLIFYSRGTAYNGSFTLKAERIGEQRKVIVSVIGRTRTE